MTPTRPLTALSDRELVALTQEGHRDAYGELYHRHYPTILSFLARRLWDRDLVADLVAETFTRGLGGIGSLTDHRGTVAGWFTTIARNLFNDHVKCAHTQRAAPTPVFEDMVDATDVDSAVGLTLLRQELDAGLARLRPQHRASLVLRYYRDLSSTEMAVELGCRVAAAKAMQHRAVVALRAVLPPELVEYLR